MKDAQYSVKTWYHIAHKELLIQPKASSSHNQLPTSFWNRIWNIEASQKVKMFCGVYVIMQYQLMIIITRKKLFLLLYVKFVTHIERLLNMHCYYALGHPWSGSGHNYVALQMNLMSLELTFNCSN